MRKSLESRLDAAERKMTAKSWVRPLLILMNKDEEQSVALRRALKEEGLKNPPPVVIYVRGVAAKRRDDA